jgi:hypothetical protein
MLLLCGWEGFWSTLVLPGRRQHALSHHCVPLGAQLYLNHTILTGICVLVLYGTVCASLVCRCFVFCGTCLAPVGNAVLVCNTSCAQHYAHSVWCLCMWFVFILGGLLRPDGLVWRVLSIAGTIISSPTGSVFSAGCVLAVQAVLGAINTHVLVAWSGCCVNAIASKGVSWCVCWGGGVSMWVGVASGVISWVELLPGCQKA